MEREQSVSVGAGLARNDLASGEESPLRTLVSVQAAPAHLDFDREEKIAQFAKEYGFHLSFYKLGLCAIFVKNPTNFDL